MKTYYLHTLDGRPAMFDGNQICFANYHGKATELCRSLKAIRKQQRYSNSWRKKQGFYDNSTLGHIRVCLPD